MLAILLIVAVLGYAGLVVTELPGFCGLCHQMTEFYISWQQAPHREFTCVDCHSGEGVAGFAYHILDASVSLTGWITGNYEEPLLGFVPDVWCLKCHEEVEEQDVVVADNIRMSHEEPHQAGWNCVDCHSAVAHPRATANPTSPQMEDCFHCHDGRRASFSCDTCHTNDVAGRPSNTHELADFRGDTHVALGLTALSSCRPCHGERAGANPCVECHSLALPHPADFLTTHGQLVLENRVDCRECHTANDFCINCHGVDMPHPQTFTAAHISLVEDRGDDVCFRCHTQQDCDSCHGRHPENTGHPEVEEGGEED